MDLVAASRVFIASYMSRAVELLVAAARTTASLDRNPAEDNCRNSSDLAHAQAL